MTNVLSFYPKKCTISKNFLSSTLKCFDKANYLVSVNAVFDGLSSEIKFITYSVCNYSVIPLEKYFYPFCIRKKIDYPLLIPSRSFRVTRTLFKKQCNASDRV